jgi:hypothetical protein
MKKIFLFFSLIFINSSVSAEWISFGFAADTNNQYFYEKNNIKLLPNNKIRVWMYQNLEKSLHEYQSLRSYEEFDCKEYSYKVFQIDAFTQLNVSGNQINIPTKQEILYIAPNSVRTRLLEIICHKKL